ncbi:4-hydroxybenzoate octaprenyltransferase [Aliidiomarina halalkaliphila]|uniref:4-hydroxybenzoate octaprenyltransferase n=1 Tax=Aliidiomarina halalkaliphila TaxID=2593535 RepID=A0A552X1T7_9GAMM|nr:4-hydroxybenzoate octaprenyltransferase [Aliidiomarina halalkaliphila]TRW49010.1 4-hydroxybenzoate octaprenyltransferase [Aliidiomarina halalkaliphila]
MTRFDHYRALMRMDKPIGTWLLAWPTFWALLIAGNGDPSVRLVAIFAVGVFLMRSAGCVINDYADRKLDGHVERTRNRPLATGAVTPTEALILFAVLVILAFMLVLTLNTLTILLSFVAAGLAIAYPFTKRFTHLPQFVLGAAFSMAIPMAFAAESNSLPLICWILFAANVLWTVAYDTEYAMVDRADDLRVGIKSTAILFGQYDILVIGALQAATIFLLGIVGWMIDATWIFWLALITMALFFIWQLWLIRDRSPQECFLAFRQNHYAGMLIAIGLALHYWLPIPFGSAPI